jgi:hypothetical protein
MPDHGKQDQLRLGFLAAIEAPDRGFVGGLLVTNHLGRPLEFQCTAPVKPNRTQEILYGPTLAPYLLCELIGRTLVERVGVKPGIVLVEQPELLELRDHVPMAVACLEADPSVAQAGDEARLALGRQALRFHAGHASDREFVGPHADRIPRDADLSEPFFRVREALKETLGIAERAA